jgi:pimeloyl-ACP methyl ester carboxylesterase
VALNAHTWDTFALAARRPLLALDLPGHGSSAWREDARYDPLTIAPAVAEVIGKEAPGAITLVGQSLGGLTAIAVSALRPGLVERIVLIDVSPGIRGANQVRSFLSGPEVFSSREEIVERARSFGFGHSRESVARGVEHNTRVRDDGSVVWKHHVGNLGGGLTFAVDLSALWPPLESFRGPVLLVRGERGFLSREDADELRRRAPQTEVVDVPAGHNVQEDEPVLLAEIVNRFLASKAIRP